MFFMIHEPQNKTLAKNYRDRRKMKYEHRLQLQIIQVIAKTTREEPNIADPNIIKVIFVCYRQVLAAFKRPLKFENLYDIRQEDTCKNLVADFDHHLYKTNVDNR